MRQGRAGRAPAAQEIGPPALPGPESKALVDRPHDRSELRFADVRVAAEHDASAIRVKAEGRSRLDRECHLGGGAKIPEHDVEIDGEIVGQLVGSENIQGAIVGA